MTYFPVVTTGENVTRQVLSDHPEMMAVAFRVAAQGAVSALHNYVHVQSTYMQDGRFRFTIGDEQRKARPGDSFVIPSEMVHGCVCLEPGTLVDCFSPRRDDFCRWKP